MNSDLGLKEKLRRPTRQMNIVLRPANSTLSNQKTQQENRCGKILPNTGRWAGWKKELDGLIGLTSVKEMVFEIYALLQIMNYRHEVNLQAQAHVYHMVFKGNPGTGKTTIARLFAHLFQEMNLLSKGHFIEVERADLVGEYIGHTAQKTRELIRKAKGGVLFIDEAYSLARGGEKDFGKEAIDTLVKAMEDFKNQFILILAGYTQEMDLFLQTNPGLPSRFPIQIEFPDYSVRELLLIAQNMVKERDYTLLTQTVYKLKQMITQEKEQSLCNFSNARFVRNLLEQAMRYQAVRLLSEYSSSPGKQELMTLKPVDIKWKRFINETKDLFNSKA